MSRGPDLIIIGAMKCATSTLHDQLARQPGLFMSVPKEPNFFSDDAQYARGFAWYTSLFADARPGTIRGESSTHYTKLPTLPNTVGRMCRALPGVKLIYVMRHPIDRLVSQYVHEWTERTISGSLELAVRRNQRLVDYSRYSMQLLPYLRAFGDANILPLFLERLIVAPQHELERVCKFIGYGGQPVWQHDQRPSNVSSQRLRKSALRDALVWNPLVTRLRRQFIPQAWRDRVKGMWQVKDRPQLSAALAQQLTAAFDEDLSVLGQWVGTDLNCENFKETVSAASLDFAACAGRNSA